MLSFARTGAFLFRTSTKAKMTLRGIQDLQTRAKVRLFAGFWLTYGCIKFNLTFDCCFAASKPITHSIPIVESKTLARVSLAVPLKYNLATLPNKSGLSQMQYETVRLICQRHELILPNHTRAGFLLG